MHNQEIRNAAKEAGVYLWQIAERYGISDFYFSRKLRRELPEDDQKRILAIIAELAQEE